MKKDQIEKGGRYRAKVSGRVVTVKVLEIRETVRTVTDRYSRTGLGHRTREVYDVLNEATGRRTTFRSAARFRGPAPALGDRQKPKAPPPEAKHPDYPVYVKEVGVLPPDERPLFADWLQATAARRGGYVCPHCGQIHVSDDTALWCGLAKDTRDARPVVVSDGVPFENFAVKVGGKLVGGPFRTREKAERFAREHLAATVTPVKEARDPRDLFAENNPRGLDAEEE